MAVPIKSLHLTKKPSRDGKKGEKKKGKFRGGSKGNGRRHKDAQNHALIHQANKHVEGPVVSKPFVVSSTSKKMWKLDRR